MHQHGTRLSAAMIATARLWLLCILIAVSLHGGDAEDDGELIPVPLNQVPMILLNDDLFNQGFVDSENSTGERIPTPPPHMPAKPGAYILRWDRYRTLVVIDDSYGLVKGCWIVTLTTMPEQIPTPRGPVMLARGQVVVAYRGQAYYDKDGTLQIDAHKAKLTGSMWDNWSPDSFSILPDKQVQARDDDPSHPANEGEIEKEVSAEQQAAEYRKLSFAAQAIIAGNI